MNLKAPLNPDKLAETWPKVEESIDEAVKRLHGEGLTIKAIAYETGLHRSTVMRWFARLGISGNGRADAFSTEDDKLILKLTRQGLNAAEIGRRMGRSWDSVRTRRAVLRGKKAKKNRGAGKQQTAPASPKLENDDLHVAACLAQGGFVRAEVLNGRAVWIWPVRNPVSAVDASTGCGKVIPVHQAKAGTRIDQSRVGLAS